MVLGFLNIIPLHVPLHAVILIGFILFIFLLFISHNANYSICKMRSSYMLMEEELRKELSQNLLEINSQKRSVLNIQSYLHKYYDDVRNDNFVSVASSIFPMLGILGTFIAIAISMPNFSVTDTAALDHEISVLLSGVGSAFFASIYGILLSLIWTYFEKRGLSKIEHYFAQVQETFKLNVWSQDELTIHRHTQDALKDNKFIAALKETFNLEFVQNMNEQHMRNFKEIMTQTNDKFTHISNHLQSVSSDLKDTISHIDHSKSSIEAKNQIENTLVDFTQATRSLEKSTKMFNASLNNSLDKTFDKIDFEIGNIVIKLADFATHVSLESKEVQHSIKSYHEMIASQVKNK
jgi:hypothetical protein